MSVCPYTLVSGRLSAILQVLSDPKKREVYDAYGEDGLKNGMPPGGPGGGMGGMPGGGFGGFSTRCAAVSRFTPPMSVILCHGAAVSGANLEMTWTMCKYENSNPADASRVSEVLTLTQARGTPPWASLSTLTAGGVAAGPRTTSLRRYLVQWAVAAAAAAAACHSGAAVAAWAGCLAAWAACLAAWVACLVAWAASAGPILVRLLPILPCLPQRTSAAMLHPDGVHVTLLRFIDSAICCGSVLRAVTTQPCSACCLMHRTFTPPHEIA